MGAFNMVTGLALLPASLIAGGLWDQVSHAAPFWYGGVVGLAAAVALLALVRPSAAEVE